MCMCALLPLCGCGWQIRVNYEIKDTAQRTLSAADAVARWYMWMSCNMPCEKTGWNVRSWCFWGREIDHRAPLKPCAANQLQSLPHPHKDSLMWVRPFKFNRGESQGYTGFDLSQEKPSAARVPAWQQKPVLPEIQTAGDDADMSLDCPTAEMRGESRSSPADEASHPAFCFAKQSEGFYVCHVCLREPEMNLTQWSSAQRTFLFITELLWPDKVSSVCVIIDTVCEVNIRLFM